jgi:WD40 repeat protein
MIGEELERRPGTRDQAELDDDGAAPEDLPTNVVATSPRPSRPPGARRRLTFLAAALALVVGGGCTAGGGSQLPGEAAASDRSHVVAPPSPLSSDSHPSVTPTATPSLQVSDSPASQAPTATPSRDPGPTATPSGDLAPGFAWTRAPDGGNGTLGEIAVPLAGGRVLVMGGCATAAQLYDPAAGTFTTTGSLTEPRSGKTATLLSDGRVLVTGGYDCTSSEGGISASAEVYDPETGTFTAVGGMKEARQFHTATLLDDGRVLITGGHSNSPTTGARVALFASVRTAETSSSVLSTAELFDPATDTFRSTGSMSTIRDHHTATALPDGTVLVVGGGGEAYASTTSADLFDPGTGQFQATGPMRDGRWLHTASLLPDGRVLVVGGRSPRDAVYDTAELYDPGSGTFSSAGSMRDGRQQHTATVLPDGRVLIAGGVGQDEQRARVLSATETFDPSADSFASIGSMGDPRSEHTATLLRDGRVLIMGGIEFGPQGGGPVTSAVLYEP